MVLYLLYYFQVYRHPMTIHLKLIHLSLWASIPRGHVGPMMVVATLHIGGEWCSPRAAPFQG